MSSANPLLPSTYRFSWPLAIALFVLTVLVYVPSMFNGFIWDDPAYVVDNPTLKSLGGLWDIWTNPLATPQYYPLVHSTFWVEARLWGTTTATGFHIDNILLHACAVVLLWRALLRLNTGFPALSAAIFAVHPVMVESVTWVTERKNVLSIVFYLLALHAYLRSGLLDGDQPSSAAGDDGATPARDDLQNEAPDEARDETQDNTRNETPRLQQRGGAPPASRDTRQTASRAPRHRTARAEQDDAHFKPGPRQRTWYRLSLLFFLLALWSKTVTCSLPAAILLIVWWKRGRITWRDVKPLIPMFIIGLSLSAFTGHLERTHVGARGPDFNWTLLERGLIAGHAVCFYAMKILWPHPLLFMYPRWNLHAADAWIYPGIVFAVIVALWFTRRHIGRGPLVAVLFFIGTLTPALGFVNVYPMRYSFVADHFQYLASLGLIALIGSVLCRISRWIPSKLIVVLVLAPLVYLTVVQQAMYRDQRTLWETTIAQNETSWMAHINLAGVYSRDKQLNKAIVQSRRALALAPDEADTQFDMGVACCARQQWSDAVEYFRAAIRCDDRCAPAWSYLALVQWEHIATDSARAEAITDAGKALEIDANLSDPYYVLGCFDELRNDTAGAIAHYEQSLKINPDNAAVHTHLGNCLMQVGRVSEAAGEYTKVLRTNPKDVAALTNLGNANLQAGRREQAIECYHRALAIDPGFIAARDGLKRAGT